MKSFIKWLENFEDTIIRSKDKHAFEYEPSDKNNPIPAKGRSIDRSNDGNFIFDKDKNYNKCKCKCIPCSKFNRCKDCDCENCNCAGCSCIFYNKSIDRIKKEK